MICVLLALLIGAAFSATEDKKCMKNVLCDMGQKTFEACSLDAKLAACEAQLAAQSTRYALVCSHAGESFGFVTSAANPVNKAYEALEERALKEFSGLEGHSVDFTWENDDPAVGGVINDDASLEEALAIAKSLNFVLTVNARRVTDSPTASPTADWTQRYSVFQKTGSVADGRDNGYVTGRQLTFNKVSDTTSLRIHYEDNIRAYNNGAVCYWEIHIDGKTCPSNKIRGALHSQGNTNNDHQTSSIIGLCGSGQNFIQAGQHTIKISVSGNGRDCYTGWDPESKGTFMIEVREVISGQNGYWGVTQYGSARGEDNMGKLPGRRVTFTKAKDSTKMRVLYMDNLRVYNTGKVCKWTIKVDGKDCNGADKLIATSLHTGSGENDHIPQAIMGYCDNLKGGIHEMSIAVNTLNAGDCYTGWETSDHVEAQEVGKTPSESNPITVFQRFGNNIDGRDSGWVNWRVLKFTKYDATSVMRLQYFDNIRVHGHGKWCKWEIRVDGKACPMNLSGTRYVVSNQNNHAPGMIAGYCTGLAKGDHEMKIHVRGNAADCYTGWDGNSKNNFVLEAREIAKDVVFGTY